MCYLSSSKEALNGLKGLQLTANWNLMLYRNGELETFINKVTPKTYGVSNEKLLLILPVIKKKEEQENLL